MRGPPGDRPVTAYYEEPESTRTPEAVRERIAREATRHAEERYRAAVLIHRIAARQGVDPTGPLEALGLTDARPPGLCACGHLDVVHNLGTRGGIAARTACSTSSGPHGTPCPCKTFIPERTSL